MKKLLNLPNLFIPQFEIGDKFLYEGKEFEFIGNKTFKQIDSIDALTLTIEVVN